MATASLGTPNHPQKEKSYQWNQACDMMISRYPQLRHHVVPVSGCGIYDPPSLLNLVQVLVDLAHHLRAAVHHDPLAHLPGSGSRGGWSGTCPSRPAWSRWSGLSWLALGHTCPPHPIRSRSCPRAVRCQNSSSSCPR